MIIDIKDFLPQTGGEERRESSIPHSPEAEIEELIRALGVSRNYVGYHYLVKAVGIAVENRKAVEAVTKEIYPDVAKYYGTTVKAVERGIRTVRDVIWKYANRAALEAIMGFHLTERPKNSQLIDGLAHYISRNRK